MTETRRASLQPWTERQFLFVGGMHRSGTTLLARILSSSSQTAGLESSGAHMGEGQFLQTVYPRDRVFGGVTSWALSAESHFTESNVHDGDAEGLWNSWSPHWDLSARYLVEKTPANISKSRYLQEMFPNSTFVIITRHPVVQALAVRKWSPTRRGRWGLEFSDLIHNWVIAQERFLADRPRLRNCIVLRYEDLVRDSATQIRALGNALELDLDGAAEQFDGRNAGRYREEWEQRLARTYFSAEETSSIRKRVRSFVERHVFPWEARKARRLYGERIRALGYDFDDLTEGMRGNS